MTAGATSLTDPRLSHLYSPYLNSNHQIIARHQKINASSDPLKSSGHFPLLQLSVFGVSVARMGIEPLPCYRESYQRNYCPHLGTGAVREWWYTLSNSSEMGNCVLQFVSK